MNHSNLLGDQKTAYTERFNEFGATPKGVFWNNVETQYLRFDRLLHNIISFIEGCSIHDVGAGTCDLHRYLHINNINHEYSGTEIVQEMIDYSLKQYPNIKLYNRNFTDEIINEKYDFLLLSGTLNLMNKCNLNEWEEFCYSLISKMYNISTKAISFNCLSSNRTFSDPSLYYFNPMEVFDFCVKNLSRFVLIDHCYPLYEFTVTVFKPEFLEKNYENIAFSKYFKNI
jgi:hypothetical protein